MSAPFAPYLFGWRKPRNSDRLIPNCADSHNPESIQIAEGMLNAMGLTAETRSDAPPYPGVELENSVCDDLSWSLTHIDGKRQWEVSRKRVITDFAQYSHLRQVDELVRRSAELRVTIGRDYLIEPDVTVGITDLDVLDKALFLHAAVSCKWTIRSDRVQNIRHECNQMIRHRRGRQPHLVTVTAEPLPSRLASITRGTGEVDAVYHIAFDALQAAVLERANATQREAWDECVQQRRLLPYEALARTLALW